MLSRTKSAVLSRRTSSLTLRVRGKAPRHQAPSLQPVFISPKPRFPTEIVELIINLVLSSCPCSDLRRSAVASIICASKALREIALGLFFRDVVVGSRVCYLDLWNLLLAERDVMGVSDSFGWVRSLFGPSHMIRNGMKSLGAFVNLRTLEICFITEGFETQDLIVTLLLDSFAQSPAKLNLKSLALMHIPRIDTKLLGPIAKTFPQLTKLELTTTNCIEIGCCSTCLESSLECTRHSPIPDYYLSAESLAKSFAKSLRPLEKLENLYLGIYLSDAYILEEHIAHSDGGFGGLELMTRLPLCAICRDSLKQMRQREIGASKILANTFPSLVKIQWDTLFLPLAKKSTECAEDDFYFRDEDETLVAARVPYVSVFVFDRADGFAELVKERRF